MSMKLNVPPYVLRITEILNSNGFEAYLVGGCVRDAVMGKTPHDYDITTNALPEEIIKCFNGFRIIETGLKHGTVTVVSDGENIEVTTYRIDGVYLDNRRPESVTFTACIDEDLSRRDFTVNAMAYNPHSGFVDIFDGMHDIAQKRIRCVGNADRRFEEDGLRIMRAMRFASVLNFNICSDTSEAIHRNRHLLENISAERIYTELKKLICGSGACEILTAYFDVMCVIFPLLKEKEELYMANVKQLENMDPDYVLRFSCVLNGFDSHDVKDFMRRLKPDNNTMKNVGNLTKYLSVPFKCDRISIRYLMTELSDANIRRTALLKSCFDLHFDYEEFMYSYEAEFAASPCVAIKQLAVNGGDIISLGIKPGVEVGRYMNEILKAVIEERCENTKESIISYIKTMAE